MFYFKEAPISPTKLDPNQLALITEFRKQIGEKGALYWTFNRIEEFTQLIRTHLSRVVQEWRKTWGEAAETRNAIQKPSKHKVIDTKDTEGINEEEKGLIDLTESGMEKFEILIDVLKHITAEMQNLDKKIRQRTEELKSATSTDANVNIKQKKRAINLAAVDMEHFNVRMEEEIPKFFKSHSEGANA
ncbi:unnamed protein product, partial [marine sediment metagenome]